LKKELPEAKMVMVTGPRIEPASLPEIKGLAKRAYVHNLFEHLSCADAAVVQGGLSTTMELVATRRPFVYFPLKKHWEQVHHVAFRLDRYQAGIRLDYAQTSIEELAKTLRQTLERPVSYKTVEAGGAARVARRIADLL
jgi:UDP:flavonoid glycosyltransferase YjiC (YdhE family)